jgi:MFS family permease
VAKPAISDVFGSGSCPTKSLIPPLANGSMAKIPIPYLPALLLLLSELAELLLVSPRIRLLEAAICRIHYHVPSVPEDQCKIPEVQARLAHIRGWQVFFEALPVMILAVPWGALADSVGKKRVLALNFLGCAAHIIWFAVVCNPASTMAVEWVWASALAFVLGGGPRTAGVLILALVNDVSPGEERYEESNWLLCCGETLTSPPGARDSITRTLHSW